MSDHAAGAETTLGLFEGYGIELEYMIVDRETLDVSPKADEVLRAVSETGLPEAEVERGRLAWSNELALHVIELKTNGPAPSLAGLGEAFRDDLREIDGILAPHGARILPTAMHPWMDPDRDFRLWPHEYNPVYEAFDRIFGCRGHGWANVQSMHLNLPFRGDDELGRLHEAIRLVLPILPALAASSPVVEGRVSGTLDNRLAHYCRHAVRLPSMMGQVIPEPVFTRADYEREVLGWIYRELEPHDPEGILRFEWANARGAIVRFDRMAIEIRLIDVQETPDADVAIAGLVTAVVRALTSPAAAEEPLRPERLRAILERTIGDADEAVIDDAEYLAALGAEPEPVRAGDLWRTLRDRELPGTDPWLDVILRDGPLARRIVRALGPAPDRTRLTAVYRRLADCALSGAPFLP